MEYIPVTSFRRPITAVQLERHTSADRAAPPEVNKWDALRKLAASRQHFGLSDRDLTVLQALLGFHPETALGHSHPEAIVFPSNKAICERLNGMPCSTMRRHIARLVDAGMILRRDSPNGKRYVHRRGGAQQAYGFDLSPLAVRFKEFERIADDLAEAQAHRKRLRDTVSLMRRDLAALVNYGMTQSPELGFWDRMSDLAHLTARDLRRQLNLEELADIERVLRTALQEVTAQLDLSFASDPSTSDAENEQHHQTSNKEYIDIEPAAAQNNEDQPNPPKVPPPPLRLVLETCKEIQTYSSDTVRHWDDMVRLSDKVSPMMGIPNPVWREAQMCMGPAETACVLAAMLERFSSIKSPAAYLRFLGKKAERGCFSAAAMIRTVSAGVV